MSEIAAVELAPVDVRLVEVVQLTAAVQVWLLRILAARDSEWYRYWLGDYSNWRLPCYYYRSTQCRQRLY